MTSDEKQHLLQTIQFRKKQNEVRANQNVRQIPITRREIYRGCYDVWFCKQDEIDATEIPKRILAEAVSLGWISRTEGKEPEYDLTDLGMSMLE